MEGAVVILQEKYFVVLYRLQSDFERFQRPMEAIELPKVEDHVDEAHCLYCVLVPDTDAELADAPTETPQDYSVVVLSIHELKTIYEAVYESARQSVINDGDAQ